MVAALRSTIRRPFDCLHPTKNSLLSPLRQGLEAVAVGSILAHEAELLVKILYGRGIFGVEVPLVTATLSPIFLLVVANGHSGIAK